MARLIEFFTTSGELVLDPFAGVGGTLLGAAIARGPRRALGLEIEPRWVDDLPARWSRTWRPSATAAGPLLADIGPSDPGGERALRPVGPGDAPRRLAACCCPSSQSDSVDFVATDPPYNIQLPITMSGGKLAESHANRRTDYAMVTDHDGDLANSADYATFLDRMEVVFAELLRVLRPERYAAVIVRDAYQDGRYIFTGSDLADRATRAGFTVKGDVIWYQAGTRLRPYGYPRAFVPNISHQHVLILRRELREEVGTSVEGEASRGLDLGGDDRIPTNADSDSRATTAPSEGAILVADGTDSVAAAATGWLPRRTGGGCELVAAAN